MACGRAPTGWAAGVAVPALSAVDIAIWDLWARRAGLPLYRLLGAYRGLDRVAGMDLEELVETATGHVAEGSAAIKLFCGGRPLAEELGQVDLPARLRRCPAGLWSGERPADALGGSRPSGLLLGP